MTWVQEDAPEIIRRWLRGVVQGPRVRSELPEKWTPADGLEVVVVSDGTPVTDRGWTRENVRVTVHGLYEPQVRGLAVRIDGALLDRRHVPGVTVSPGPGLIITRDENLGGFIAAVTFRVAATRKES